MEIDGVEYEDDADVDDAAMDGVPKFQIFLKIIGVLILIAAVVILGYFQWEELKISRNTIPNVTSSIYNSSCSGGICIYEFKNKIPTALECYYKNNKTECSEISFEFIIEGTKVCVNELCKIESAEEINKCLLGGWAIDCEKIEVRKNE